MKQYLPLIPLLVIGGMLIVLSLISTFIQALGYAPVLGIMEFPTLKYYGHIFHDKSFISSLGISLLYAIVPTIFSVIVGIWLALLFRAKFYGKRWLMVITRLPLTVPYLVVISLVLLFFSNGGLIARVAYHLGFIDHSSQFPRILKTSSGWGVLMVYVWKQVPFIIISISATLSRLNPKMQEAAQILGAKRTQVFWNITWPQILPSVFSSAMVIFSFNFGSFEAPFLLGGRFLKTLPVVAWQAWRSPYKEERLESIAMMSIVLLFAVFMIFIYLMGIQKMNKRFLGK